MHRGREPRLDLFDGLPFSEKIGDGCREGLDFLRRKPVNYIFIIFFRKALIVLELV